MKLKSILFSFLLIGLCTTVVTINSGTANATKWKCAKAPCEQPGPDVTPPSAPGSVTLQEVVVGDQWGVRLEWTAATDDNYVSNYEVVRLDNDTHAVDGYMIPGSQTSYNDLFFRVNTGALVDYSYIVIAYDAAGNASVPSNEVHYPHRAVLEVEPVTIGDQWGARLVWNTLLEYGNVDRFVITRNDNFGGPTEEITVSGNQVSYNDLMFRINTGVSAIFYYTITAYDEYGYFLYTSNSAVFDTDAEPAQVAPMIETSVESANVLRDYAEIQTSVLNMPDLDYIELLIDGDVIHSSDMASDIFYLNTYAYTDGDYEFTVRAYDVSGNAIEKSITITVNNYSTIY